MVSRGGVSFFSIIITIITLNLIQKKVLKRMNMDMIPVFFSNLTKNTQIIALKNLLNLDI